MLNIKYNIQPMHMVYSYRLYMAFFGQKRYYSKSVITEALNNPVIYHTFRYLGEFPWHLNSLHPAVGVFDHYLELSLWNDFKKSVTDRNDYVFRTERLLYRILPKPVFMVVFKACYELFLWKSNRDSLRKMNNVRM